MIRDLQANTSKPVQIVVATADVTRGAPVVYDAATNKIVAATADGFGFVDISPNYDGINAYRTPTDADFEEIKAGDLCLYKSYCHGERIATNQITMASVTAGTKLTVTGGKLAKASTGGDWVYVGPYTDPDFDDMHIIQHL